MKTNSQTRNRCRGRCSAGRPCFPAADPPRTPIVGVLLLAVSCLAALAAGCSDDVVCTEETKPYIAARVEQTAAARAGSTFAEVYCVADPLPGQFAVSITGRDLPDIEEAPDLPGLVATLSDTIVVWTPGSNCVLEVSTEYGPTSALEPVPGSFTVSAPDTVAPGEELVLSWTEADEADYYRVEGTIDGTASEQVIDIAVEGTSLTLDPEEIETPGLLEGRVWAVAGPFPQSGSAGNVTGEGWGYLTVSYRGPGSEFEVVIRETPAP